MRSLSIPPPSTERYVELIRSADLSCGVYRLPAGSIDEQHPHAEDELYFVIAGRATFTSGGEAVDVKPGVCLFVPAREAHRFHDITEPLELLVCFGPAEGARARGDVRRG